MTPEKEREHPILPVLPGHRFVCPAEASPRRLPAPQRRGFTVRYRHASGRVPRRQRRLTDLALSSDMCDRRAVGIPVERASVT